ncbi:hypothetical protein [Nocardia sp. CDC160]|uniref:hypothetical protein n=1 Tax=Nocardia sp. CDC160 TaxID=3112166 RepID=UPI002DB6F91E|nr:hypothetical protein [Nocardia sp. CDC160]MEC3918216.1 hypothetical protein [Nocardia sp. CDC160]
MPSDVPVAGMLKSYKKVSRWYPALDPASQAPVLEQPDGDAVFDDGQGPARFPHYIQDAEPEDEIPPIPESVLRRNHFDGAWSDWMTGRTETDSHTPPPRYRGSAVVEFPSDTAETAAPATDRASQLLDAVSDEVSTRPQPGRARRLFGLGFLIVAIVLLAIVGGVALYVLNSHGGTAQSIGTPAAGPGSGPIAVVAAYNEMTAFAIVGDHGPAASVPAG